MKLADASVSLNIDPFKPAISKISERDGSLGAMLSEYANKFAYTELFRAIKPREARGLKGSL